MERADIEPYVRRIEEIDKLLKGPGQTLIDIVAEDLGRKPDPRETGTASAGAYQFPAFLSDTMTPRRAQPLTHAICCATLQRLWNVRRRFDWLEKSLDGLRSAAFKLERDDLKVREAVARPVFRAELTEPEDLVPLLENDDFGPLDAFTASQVFWVLLNAGEKRLHSPIGFLAFFIMVWALNRRFPDPSAAGVSVGGCPPTAWITAKCVGPLSTLAKICTRRKRLFEQIRSQVARLRSLSQEDGPEAGRNVPFVLEELVKTLVAVSNITIGRAEFKRSAEAIEAELEQPDVGDVEDAEELKGHCLKAVNAVADALRVLGKETDVALDPVSRLIGAENGEPGLLGELVNKLGRARKIDEEVVLEKGLRIKLPMPPLSDEAAVKFWKDQRQSSERALTLTRKAFEELSRAREACSEVNLPLDGDIRNRAQAIGRALDTLIQANKYIAEQVRKELSAPAAWCEVVMTRQVAYASSGNWTEFDPAELASSLYVGVTRERVQGDLAVQDAIEKALKGHRGDGSWAPGQPFWSKGGVGLGPPTSEVAWMLAEILARYPKVSSADEVLGKYVEWLERTRKRIPRAGTVQESSSTPGGEQESQLSEAPPGQAEDRKEGQNLDKEEDEESAKVGRRETWAGWVTERELGNRIDLWATAFGIDALLGIRDLMEFRLWERCEKRFKVLPPGKPLGEIDPVDLEMPHARRLHHRLSKMARETDGDGYKDAEYSLILHGPPGSSKTAVIQSLAGEMWQEAQRRGSRGARLIRITPADFTRMGEDRLDSEAALIFEVLGRIRGVTILFDEIDDLLQKRKPSEGLRFMDLVVPAMLNRLQDLRDDCPRQEVAFLLATNYVEKIERALIRKGRIDDAVPVLYPDRRSREWIIARHVGDLRKREKKEPPLAWSVADLLAEDCQGEWLRELDRWPWKDIDELFREASRRLGLLNRRGSSQEDAREEFGRLTKRGGENIPRPPYSERRGAVPDSQELQREIILYALSNCDRRGELDDLMGEYGITEEDLDTAWKEYRPPPRPAAVN